MLAMRESCLSSVTPKFLEDWVGANTKLSKLLHFSPPLPGNTLQLVLRLTQLVKPDSTQPFLSVLAVIERHRKALSVRQFCGTPDTHTSPL
ncbi:unnamed protein product [Pleuronectes platessa]|uniref:Uncharacterized protein n=1 Tax=Pleuronectes platessa TaxID=8262 RepID=A0A9N7UVN0_PLEPL|nr:unnamed protein product [Pleuronectes platessa]